MSISSVKPEVVVGVGVVGLRGWETFLLVTDKSPITTDFSLGPHVPSVLKC